MHRFDMSSCFDWIDMQTDWKFGCTILTCQAVSVCFRLFSLFHVKRKWEKAATAAVFKGFGQVKTSL